MNTNWLITVLDDLVNYCHKNGDSQKVHELHRIRAIYQCEVACKERAARTSRVRSDLAG